MDDKEENWAPRYSNIEMQRNDLAKRLWNNYLWGKEGRSKLCSLGNKESAPQERGKTYQILLRSEVNTLLGNLPSSWGDKEWRESCFTVWSVGYHAVKPEEYFPQPWGIREISQGREVVAGKWRGKSYDLAIDYGAVSRQGKLSCRDKT